MPAPPPEELQAGAWRLIALTGDDWPLEHAMSRERDVVVWTLYQPDMSEAEARARIRRSAEAAAAGEGCRYRIVGEVGSVGTAGIAAGSSGAPEVFYALLSWGRHRGAATAAARALSDWALSNGARRVVLLTIVGNRASEAVATRAGFAREGVEYREHHGAPAEMIRWARTS